MKTKDNAPTVEQPRPCLMCRRATYFADRHCVDCRRHILDAREYQPDYHDGLWGGHWYQDGLIRRWVQTKPAELPPADQPPCGTERGYQWHRHQWRQHCEGIWPLPDDDPCGCRAAHAAYEIERQEAKRSKPPSRRRLKADAVEDFDWLVSQGMSREAAAERVGVTLATIRDYRTKIAREQAA